MNRFFSPKTKKVLFFDWNHTLVDQHKTFRSHFTALLDEFAGRWDDSGRWNANEVYRRYEQEWRKLKSGRRRMKTSRMRQISLRKALQPYPFDTSDRFMRSFFQELRSRIRKQPVLFPQTLKVLDQLSGKYRLALISNGSHIEMKSPGLSSYFPDSQRFTAGKYGVRKPNPILFRKALDGMGVTAGEAVMIGNSWRHDIQGAVRSGIDAVWLKKGMSGPIRNKKGRKIIRVQSIGELTDIF